MLNTHPLPSTLSQKKDNAQLYPQLLHTGLKLRSDPHPTQSFANPSLGLAQFWKYTWFGTKPTAPTLTGQLPTLP